MKVNNESKLVFPIRAPRLVITQLSFEFEKSPRSTPNESISNLFQVNTVDVDNIPILVFQIGHYTRQHIQESMQVRIRL